MGNEDPGNRCLVLKPPLVWRIWGWLLAGLGVLFGSAGFGAGADIGTTLTMLVVGLIFAGLGVVLATARVACGQRGIRYRYGISRSVASDAVASITADPRAGAFYGRICIDVNRKAGRPLRLTALQTIDSPKGRARMEAHAHAVAEAIGLRDIGSDSDSDIDSDSDKAPRC